MTYSDLPALNALLNAVSAILLATGYLHIRKGRIARHRAAMVSALFASVLFLASYLIYHAKVGSVPYPRHDWTRPLYFTILIPHVILAAVNVPFIITIVLRAWRADFERHRRLARWVFPSWMFVSVTGVVIYLMLYHLPPAGS